MGFESRTKYLEIFDELAAIMAATVVDEGLAGADSARATSLKFIARLCLQFGGQKIYIPRGLYTTEHMRGEIARRWIGRNTRALCREFNITESRLRQLYYESRDEHRASTSPTTPPIAPGARRGRPGSP